MLKEIKYLIYSLIIFIAIFFTGKYYFSEVYKKKSYRSLLNIEKRINIYLEDLPILTNDTKNIIEYVENNKTKKKKKFYFWELLDKND